MDSIEVVASPVVRKYYESIWEEVKKQVETAKKSKQKELDISTDIETTPVADLADRAETIIGPEGLAERYRTVLEEHNGDRDKTIFQIFKEIIEQKWCSIPDDSKRVEQGIKTGLVLATEGVVVAPLDGVPKVQISENPDGSKYIDIYYAGPIRAAGGTATVLPLILGDYARELMALDRYKPTEEEIERYVEECSIYEEIVSRQYKLSEEEVRKIAKGCKVCINGEPTEKREVAVHKNVPRIPTNRIRGGMCLVISEGVALKARKIMKYAKMLELDWSWLEDIIKVGKSESQELEISPNDKFLNGIAAGRPILAYPSRPGGFRLRYGRGRNMGTMGEAIHPATMYALNEFIAVSTQLKGERPGKAAGMAACSSIDGPIVRLDDGSVLRIETAAQAIELRSRVEKILFLGDLLAPVGDFIHSAHPLVRVGYCEEWWALELEKKAKERGEREEKAIKNPLEVDWSTAEYLSEKHEIPLHPRYIFYYSLLEANELKELVAEIKKGNLGETIEFEKEEKSKKSLEKAGIPHRVTDDKIVIEEDIARALTASLGLENKTEQKMSGENSLELVNSVSKFKIIDKAGTFIGGRMGRPEASTPRKMTGNPHVLFPIGLFGGNTRSINKAIDKERAAGSKGLEVDITSYYCKKCEKIICFPSCPFCGERSEKVNMCSKCEKHVFGEKCTKCGSETKPHSKRKIELEEYVSRASKKLGITVPELVKGVKGTINKDKVCEPIEKGLLRARHGINIFRDGTIRYELINAPITHFKPKEIKISLEKVKELGYEKDIHGERIEREDQIIEIFPQDIIIHDEAGDFFVKVSNFVDDELEKFYSLEPFFRFKTRTDLVGQLVLGLAPHTSAAIVGRILGFTKARACFAHPYFHQTKRRNIDGDQDSIMLLMDGLLNFSHSYLPESRGGRMDAPLVFTVMLKPTEIDDEVYDMETCWKYPLELYEETMKKGVVASIAGIEKVHDRLGKEEQYSGLGYTHETTAFDEGPKYSKYVQLGSMEDKITAQAELQTKIEAVDTKDSIERVLASHFFPDIIGNARAFSRQSFRCTNCNSKYRRIPLTGNCTRCPKGNLILTIAQGSVRKYLEIAKKVIHNYGLRDYLKQRIELVECEIDSIFVDDKEKQSSLFEFV